MKQTYLAEFGEVSDSELLKKIEEYKNNPNVEFAEPNFLVSLQEFTPNDEKFLASFGGLKIMVLVVVFRW